MISKETLSSLIDAIKSNKVTDKEITRYFMINYSETFLEAVANIDKEKKELRKIPPWVHESVHFVSQEQLILAIKCIRANTGFDLREAKNVIDFFHNENSYEGHALSPAQNKIIDLLKRAAKINSRA